jgi:succinyl-diaminopimelate desuccinylase
LDASLAAELHGRLNAVATRYVLSLEPCNALGYLATPHSFTKLVADAVEKKTGCRPALSTSGGTSDARFIRAYCPVVECFRYVGGNYETGRRCTLSLG